MLQNMMAFVKKNNIIVTIITLLHYNLIMSHRQKSSKFVGRKFDGVTQGYQVICQCSVHTIILPSPLYE